MEPRLLLFFVAIPIIATLSAQPRTKNTTANTCRRKRGYVHPMMRINSQPFQSQHSRPWPATVSKQPVTVSRSSFRALTQTLEGVTETTLWYFNSNGPNFMFKISGGLPAPQNEMIAWIEKNYGRYHVIPVPFEEHMPDKSVGKTSFRSLTKTFHGFTETTIWYYNSKGPNFKFKISGGLPAPKNEMIAWIENNYRLYNVIHVPYEGDVPDQPYPAVMYPTPATSLPRPQPPAMYPTPAPNLPRPHQPHPPVMYPTPAPTLPRPHPPVMYPTPAPTLPRPHQPHPPVMYPTPAPNLPKPSPTYPTRHTYPTWATRTTTTTTEYTPTRIEWNDILPSECGYSGYYLEKHVDGKVVGATPAPIEMNPWQIALVDASSKALKCGGSIISKNHVLTASHCFLTLKRNVGADGKIFEEDQIVPKQNRMIYAGDENIHRPAAVYKIAELFLHTKYSNSHRRNDIALILIQGEFSWSTRIYPICLPSPRADYSPNRSCRVSGWGQKSSENIKTEDHLQAGVINIVESKTCRRNYKGHLGIKKGMFCAAGFDQNLGRIDTCQGDSGGPCTCEDNARGTLYGITSWGIGCGRDNFPGVYVKVAMYLDWIHEYLEVSIGSRSRGSLGDDEDVDGAAEGDFSNDPDADIL